MDVRSSAHKAVMESRYLKDTLNEIMLFYDQDFMKVYDGTTIKRYIKGKTIPLQA